MNIKVNKSFCQTPILLAQNCYQEKACTHHRGLLICIHPRLLHEGMKRGREKRRSERDRVWARRGQIRREQRHLKERAAVLEMRAAYQRWGLQGHNKAFCRASTRLRLCYSLWSPTRPKTDPNDGASRVLMLKLQLCLWTPYHTHMASENIHPNKCFHLHWDFQNKVSFGDDVSKKKKTERVKFQASVWSAGSLNMTTFEE